MQQARGSASAARAGIEIFRQQIRAPGKAMPRKGHVFGKASVKVESHDLHIPAAVVCASQAGAAASAGYARPDLAQVALLQAAGPIDLDNSAHDLVAEDAGVCQVTVALLQHLDIGSADGAGLDLQQGSARWALWSGQILQLHDSRALQKGGFHDCFSIFLGQLYRHQHAIRLLDELLLRDPVKASQKACASHAHALFDIALGIDLHSRDLGVLKTRIGVVVGPAGRLPRSPGSWRSCPP